MAGPPNTNNGNFLVPSPGGSLVLKVQVGDGQGWDHVSVSLEHRPPLYEEMEAVRRLFFKDEECAMQLGVPRADHVNVHPNVLHWWRPQTDGEIAAVRAEWEAGGEPWEWGDLKSPGVIPRPPADLV